MRRWEGLIGRRRAPLLLLLLLPLASIALAADPAVPTIGAPRIVDRVLIEKAGRRLTLLSGDEVVQGFWIALGGDPIGHKEQEGDQRTPEGRYTIDARNAESGYYRSLRISYPNEADRERAREQGVDPGGQIMIHGLPEKLAWMGKFHRLLDWTDGCIAVTNEEMDTIWALVDVGTPVEIRP
jgi:murein L,D-transpeptidase YafK